MPFLIPALIAGASALGGMFIGSQIDDGFEKPVTVVQDNSKMPWYVTLVIWGIIALIAWRFIKKEVLK